MKTRLELILGSLLLSAALAAAQDKKDDKAAAGPFDLPTLVSVKEKCKTSEEQNGKLEAVYKDAATREEETKKRAKDNGQDRKDLEKFLGLGKIDTINKIKEVLDEGQKKTFEEMMGAANNDAAKKKKKKNNN